MNYIILVIIYLTSLNLNCTSKDNKQCQNILSKDEQKNGWMLLWNGKSFDGWRGIYKDYFPAHGWIIENDELVCLGDELPDSLQGGVIITGKKYGSFELKLEFKISKNANSDVKYFVDESLKSSENHGLGLENAILDNNNWPYDKPNYNMWFSI